MRFSIEHEGRSLDAHLHRSQNQGKIKGNPVVIATFGAPVGSTVSDQGHLDAEYAEHLSLLTSSTVVAVSLSGVGGSTGTFSPAAWAEDLQAATRFVIGDGLGESVVLIGYEFAALSVVEAAAGVREVVGIASVDPTLFVFEEEFDHAGYLELLRNLKVKVGDLGIESFKRELDEIEPERLVGDIGARPWMIITAQDRTASNLKVSRELVELASAAELHRIAAVGDNLRADPRVMAILLGWIERAV